MEQYSSLSPPTCQQVLIPVKATHLEYQNQMKKKRLALNHTSHTDRYIKESPHPICMASHTPYELTGSDIPKLHSSITVPHAQHIALFNEE